MKYFALTLIALDFYYMRTLQRDETVLEKWVEATRDLILKSERFLSALKDAETGQRGYLLTQDAGYLTPLTTTGSVGPERCLKR